MTRQDEDSLMDFTHANVREFALAMVDRVFDFACRELGVCEGDYPKLRVTIKSQKKFRWSYYKTTEPNGVLTPFVFLSLEPANEMLTFVEYEHIQFDREIGNLPCVIESINGELVPNWIKYVAATVVHEMAHFIDKSTSYEFDLDKKTQMFYDVAKIEDPEQRACHAERWQHIYRILRNQFINNDDFMFKSDKVVWNYSTGTYERETW